MYQNLSVNRKKLPFFFNFLANQKHDCECLGLLTINVCFGERIGCRVGAGSNIY